MDQQKQEQAKQEVKSLLENAQKDKGKKRRKVVYGVYDKSAPAVVYQN